MPCLDRKLGWREMKGERFGGIQFPSSKLNQNFSTIGKIWREIVSKHPHPFPSLPFPSLLPPPLPFPPFLLSKHTLKVTKFEIPLHARIVGSFNGLLLLHDLTNPEIFHVVNPVVKKKFSLPPLTGLGNIFSKAGYGLDSSGLCKVVHTSARACSNQVQIKMRVFTVGVDMSWRFIDLQGISLNTKEKQYALKCSPCFIAGFFYWYTMPYYNGVALDIDTETIYQFSFPVDLTRRDGTSIRFLSTETCLGLVRTKTDIWRFWKLTNVKTSEWTELAGINIRPVLSRVDKMFYPREMFFVWPVRLINGDFWFYRCVDEEYVVVRYNLVSDNFSFFPMTQVYSDTLIYPHVHTLLSPKNCKPGIVFSSKDDCNNY
ncbi:uncharacterized protein LOC141632632 [Silene latifolia]|uniref:uncharacterized protein LOC141632632 n=1 Tax=Silene latifolia TaxID=37657 RepID=UPI003D77CD5A